jgi:uncharacterized protein (DUF983 family)
LWLLRIVRRKDVPVEPPFEHAAGVTVPAPVRRSLPSLLTGVRRGIARKCPACGEGALFCGYLAVRPICPACGNDNDQYPSDDFAPYVTIFLVLHLMVPILFAADRTWDMSVGFEAALAIPIFLIVTLLVLPFAKGAVIGFAWSRGVTRKPETEP